MSQTRRGVRAVPAGRGRLPGASCLLFAALILACLAPARAQSLTLEATRGLGGNIKRGCWLPIEVSLENSGGDVEDDLVATIGDSPSQVRTSCRVSLASGARQRRTLFVCIDRATRSVPITFHGRKAQVILLDNETDPSDRVVLAVSDDRTALGFVQGVPVGQPVSGPYGGMTYQPQARVAHTDVAGLYGTALAYSTVDVVAFASTSARPLSPDQKRALQEWIADGGTLVVSGGSDVARLRDSFWQDLLPVRDLQAQAVASLSELGPRFGSPMPAGGAVVARGTLVPGARLWAQQSGIPLIASRQVGNGTVLFFAFDFDQAPVRGWGGQVALWKEIFGLHRNERVLAAVASPGAQRGYGMPTLGAGLTDAVTDVPAMDLPGAEVIGAFFIAYLLCLVPVNYLVLRRLDRREYAWATTPAIAAFFCLVAYFVGHHAKGGAVVPYRLDVVESDSGATTASGYAYVGLFSPRRRSYALRAPGTVGLREAPIQNRYHSGGGHWADPTRPYSLVQEDETRVQDILVNTNAMRVFTAPVREDLGGSVTADLHYTAAGIEGEITNGTRHRFAGGTLCFGRTTQSVKALGPGQTVTLDPSASRILASQGPGVYSSARRARAGSRPPRPEDRVRTAAVAAVTSEISSAGGVPQPVLIAWGDPAGTPIEVDGKHAAETRVSLYLIHLERPAARGGSITLPSNLVPGRVVVYGPGANLFPDGTLNIRSGGYVVKEFSLPGGGARVEAMTLNLAVVPGGGGPPGATMPGSGTPALSVRDPRTGIWEKLPYGAVIQVPRPLALVDPARNSIQVRVESRGTVCQLRELSATIRVR